MRGLRGLRACFANGFRPHARARRTAWAALGAALILFLGGCTAKNEPPSARILEPANGARTNARTLTFKAELNDPEGQIKSTIWNFGDGQQQPGDAEVTHTYQRGGEYTVRVTVTDDNNQSSTAAVRVSINRAPVAVARAQVPMGDKVLPFVRVVREIAPVEVQFEGSKSQDPDGEITSYRWAFGDGSASDEPDPVHTYQAAGEFEAVLTVQDNEGLSASDRVVLHLALKPLGLQDVLGEELPVVPYELISGHTLSGQESNKTVLYRYRLSEAGPFTEEQLRATLLDALVGLAQQPEISRATIYLFSEPKAGFLDPGEYDHYLGMAQWQRPDSPLSPANLVQHVVDNAEIQLNAKYLDGTAPTVVGYEVHSAVLDVDDPRCGELCQTSQGVYVNLILAPTQPDSPEGQPLCRQQVMTTIQAVLQRALAAPGGYWLNVYKGSVGVDNGVAVGLWAVNLEGGTDALPVDNTLLFTVPERWEVNSDSLKLELVKPLPDCE